MQCIARVILILLVCLSAPPDENKVQEPPASSLAEQYRALLKEYHEASGEFRRAKTDEERKAAVENLDRFPLKFLELAERNPKDSVAMDAFVELVRAVNAVDSLTQTAWEMNTSSFPAVNKDDSVSRAIALLLRDHVRSDRIGPVCERMTYGVRKEYETFLRTVLRMNPHPDVQGLACLALSRFLNSHVRKLDVAKDRPEFAKRYEGLLGRDYFEELERRGRARIVKEVEALLEEAVAKYGDVKLPFGGTVGDNAGDEIFEIRHLAAGNEAPDIEGEDQDGRRFKLSDYRGKVVLLDFWQEF